MFVRRNRPETGLALVRLTRGAWGVLVVGMFLASAAAPAWAQSPPTEAEEAVLGYNRPGGLTDAVASLQSRLEQGSVRLQFHPVRGYLDAVLEALRVPRSSQTLVFSKTSSQRDYTSPHTPRALYFSDEVCVGWVPGGPAIDLAAVDPKRGVIFYTLDQNSNQPPRFTRRDDCAQCHFGPKTDNVPGLLVRSVYTSPDGKPLGDVEAFVNGHQAALRQRWGGWYVTGGPSSPLGNRFVRDADHPVELTAGPAADLADLREKFDTSPYLSGYSDIVALLVLEHQVQMQNLLIRANYDTRLALAQRARDGYGAGERTSQTNARFAPLSRPLTRPDGHSPPLGAGEGRGAGVPGSMESRAENDGPGQRIAQAGELVLEYMLFRNEASLNGPVKGTSSFAQDFQRVGPFAAKGRSLRQFDLKTRLMRYPCSYLVYSKSFDQLPPEMKNYLWQRLAQILTGQDHSATYATLSSSDRRAVFEVLRETKPEFAAWLKQRKKSSFRRET